MVHFQDVCSWDGIHKPFLVSIFVLVFVSAKSELFGNTSNYLGELGNDECKLYSGEWVYDSSLQPPYDSWRCPFLNSEFDCLKYGRPDKQYLKYSWQPSSCTLPRSV